MSLNLQFFFFDGVPKKAMMIILSLTSSYLHTVCPIGHILVEEVAVVLDVVGQEVGGGSHHEAVSVDGVIEASRSEAQDLLVDVEEAEVHVGLVTDHPPGHVAHPLMGIVDKHLEHHDVLNTCH